MVYAGVYAVFLALHLLTVVFVVGPLVAAAAGAPRLLRGEAGQIPALQSASRSIRVYSALSVLTVLLGTALVGMKSDAASPHRNWDFADPWVGASYLLWLVALAATVGGIGRGLSAGAAQLTAGRPAGSAAGRVTAGAVVASLAWLAIVVLMVYKPGA